MRAVDRTRATAFSDAEIKQKYELNGLSIGEVASLLSVGWKAARTRLIKAGVTLKTSAEQNHASGHRFIREEAIAAVGKSVQWLARQEGSRSSDTFLRRYASANGRNFEDVRHILNRFRISSPGYSNKHPTREGPLESDAQEIGREIVSLACDRAFTLSFPKKDFASVLGVSEGMLRHYYRNLEFPNGALAKHTTKRHVLSLVRHVASRLGWNDNYAEVCDQHAWPVPRLLRLGLETGIDSFRKDPASRDLRLSASTLIWDRKGLEFLKMFLKQGLRQLYPDMTLNMLSGETEIPLLVLLRIFDFAGVERQGRQKVASLRAGHEHTRRALEACFGFVIEVLERQEGKALAEIADIIGVPIELVQLWKAGEFRAYSGLCGADPIQIRRTEASRHERRLMEYVALTYCFKGFHAPHGSLCFGDSGEEKFKDGKTACPETSSILTELRDAVQAELAKLTQVNPIAAQLLQRVHVDGEGVTTIANQLNLSSDEVGRRLEAAEKLLRGSLAGFYENPSE